MNFIKIFERSCQKSSFINANHIVAVMVVNGHELSPVRDGPITFTRIWTSARGSVAFTIDTDEALEVVMEKILQASLNHK